MKRREFVASGVSGVCALVLGRVRAQPGARNRAAVVIGVDKAGDLPALRAAASGAKSVASWLGDEGFEVQLFADDTRPVVASDLFNSIRGLVNRGTLDQLVVYFAGHGFVSGSLSEFWLLSGAPDNPNEAVSLVESRVLAKQSGIPNVVFISDACRSPADGLRATRVHGSVIFPNASPRAAVTCEVDQFLATRIGDPAWEVRQTSEGYAAIYTECFLDAFRKPYPTMVQEVNGVRVVPNRRLRVYLSQEVPKRAQATAVKINQIPDAEVCSDEPTYIARVRTDQPEIIGTPPPPPPPPPAVTLPDVASTAIATRVAGGNPQGNPNAVKALAASSGFDAARDSVVHARGLEEQLALRNGFVIAGQHLRRVMTGAGVRAEFANARAGERPAASAEVMLGSRPAASVLLEFEDGTGTVLSALRDFVGTVTVVDGRITNVSFTPSRRGPMWSEYQREAQHLERLRADVAAAARLGVLRFEGPKAERERAASSLANRIRMLKGIDPTLGLYAAYAYADAGVAEQVRSVDRYVGENLGADLFDIVMLSGRINRPAEVRGPYPFCPMLSQGWALLRVKGVRLRDDMVAARDHLIPSLWTTLDKDGVAIAQAAVRNAG